MLKYSTDEYMNIKWSECLNCDCPADTEKYISSMIAHCNSKNDLKQRTHTRMGRQQSKIHRIIECIRYYGWIWSLSMQNYRIFNVYMLRSTTDTAFRYACRLEKMARRGKRAYSIQRYKNCKRAVSLLDKVHNFVATDIVSAAAVVTTTITKVYYS